MDGALGCVIMVSPVIDPLGRYYYAKGLREDCTPPEGSSRESCPCTTCTGRPRRPWPRPPGPYARPRRAHRTATHLCLARSYEEAHPRPDLDEFILQYRKAGGQLDVTIFEGEGERILQDISTPVAKQALERMTAYIHQHIR